MLVLQIKSQHKDTIISFYIAENKYLCTVKHTVTPLTGRTLSVPPDRGVFFDTFFSKKASAGLPYCLSVSSVSKVSWFFTFTGKERDEETGYGYFGARYMDHELMTMWLSVDRYADKYPFISPYAYCAWNPIRLTDPSGDSLDVAGGKIAQNDIHSIVCPEYRDRISFDGNRVCINTEGLTMADIEKDAGFLTLYNMINCNEKFIYQAEDLVDNHGNPIVLQNNSKTPLFQYNKKPDPLPPGYDGQVILNPRAEFLGTINGEKVWSPNRASTVYHELEENYQRTVNGLPLFYISIINTKNGNMYAEIPGKLGAHGMAQRNAFRLTHSARCVFGTEGEAKNWRLCPY